MVHPLILLFPGDQDTDFDKSNGLGSLGEAVSCVVTEELNGAFELQMEYPISGRRFNDIKNNMLIYAKPNPYASASEPFRIYSITRNIGATITIMAAHISYDLDYDIVKPFSANNAQEALLRLTGSSIISPTHTYGVTTNVYTEGKKLVVEEPTSARSILGGSDNSIVGTFGGELQFVGTRIYLYNDRGVDRGFTIRYGKNLTDYNQEEILSSMYTHIYPYWIDNESGSLVELPEQILPLYNGEYTIPQTKVYPVDFSSEFEERPLIVDLRAKASQYIADNQNLGKPEVNITVSFVQLERFKEYENLKVLEQVRLGDTVSVEYPEIGVTAKAKITKTVYDALQDKYNSVDVGSVTKNLSESIAQQETHLQSQAGITEKLVNNFNKTKTELEKAVDSATDWITNGGGYMIAIKDNMGNWTELCSLDTKSLDTAMNVWRWNNGGFGHSSSGYGGPYTLAITQDGKIVANFITVGQMSFDRLNGGTIILGGKDNVDGWLVVSGTDNYGNPADTEISTQGVETANLTINSDGALYSVKEGLGKIETIRNGTFILDGEYPDISLRNGGAIIGRIFGGYGNMTNKEGDFVYDVTGAGIDTNYTGTYVDNLFVLGETRNLNSINALNNQVQTMSYSPSQSIFTDLGSGMTDDEGACYISLDDEVFELANTKMEYYVFLQKEGEGDIYISEKNEAYFVVKGTPNLKFSWELKGLKKGSEYYRLEPLIVEDDVPDLEEYYLDIIKQEQALEIRRLEASQIFDISKIVKETEEIYGY